MLVIIIGLLAGIIGGMGIGGGTILIPSLVFFAGVKQQLAQSVNLLSFIPTAIVALIVHFKHKSIETKLVLKLAALGAAGAVAGSFMAIELNSEILKKCFGVFLFVMGLYEIISSYKPEKKHSKEQADERNY